jgi:hypothetical protein
MAMDLVWSPEKRTCRLGSTGLKMRVRGFVSWLFR